MPYKDVKKQNEYNKNFKLEKYDRIIFTVDKGKKEYYQQIAKEQNVSLSEFVKIALDEKIKKLNKKK